MSLPRPAAASAGLQTLDLRGVAVDGCAEVLEDGRTALLVPPRDAPALAFAIGSVLKDRQRRLTLSQAARAASRRYDIASCVTQMQDLYDELLGPGGARAA